MRMGGTFLLHRADLRGGLEEGCLGVNPEVSSVSPNPPLPLVAPHSQVSSSGVTLASGNSVELNVEMESHG